MARGRVRKFWGEICLTLLQAIPTPFPSPLNNSGVDYWQSWLLWKRLWRFLSKVLIVYPNRYIHPRSKIAIFCKCLTPNFWPNFQMCIFRSFYEVCTSQLQACCKIQSFCEPRTQQLIKLANFLYETSEFPLKFTNFR